MGERPRKKCQNLMIRVVRHESVATFYTLYWGHLHTGHGDERRDREMTDLVWGLRPGCLVGRCGGGAGDLGGLLRVEGQDGLNGGGER